MQDPRTVSLTVKDPRTVSLTVQDPRTVSHTVQDPRTVSLKVKDPRTVSLTQCRIQGLCLSHNAGSKNSVSHTMQDPRTVSLTPCKQSTDMMSKVVEKAVSTECTLCTAHEVKDSISANSLLTGAKRSEKQLV